MAKRFPIAEARIFTNIYICMKCNARNRGSDLSRMSCRKCGYKNLRLKHKELKR